MAINPRNNNEGEEESNTPLVNASTVSLFDVFEFVMYTLLIGTLSVIVSVAYSFGRYQELGVPFNVMEFSYSEFIPLFCSFMMVVFESLLFKVYVKDKNKTDAMENVRNMENFLAIIANITIGVSIVFAIIDMIMNSSFMLGSVVIIFLYAICLFFYFKPDKSFQASSHLCAALIGITIFTFFVMGALSTKIEEINMVRVDGDTYRLVHTSDTKTILTGFDRYTKSLTGKYLIYYNNTGKYIQLNNLK